MRRRLFTSASAVSLLLFVALLTLNLRSNFIADKWHARRGVSQSGEYVASRSVDVVTHQGECYLRIIDDRASDFSRSWGGVTIDPNAKTDVEWNFEDNSPGNNSIQIPDVETHFGIGFHHRNYDEKWGLGDEWLLAVPLWLVIFFTAVLPIYWFAKRRTRKDLRIIAGLCPACVYNLTGNISGVCPECGTTVLRKPEALA